MQIRYLVTLLMIAFASPASADPAQYYGAPPPVRIVCPDGTTNCFGAMPADGTVATRTPVTLTMTVVPVPAGTVGARAIGSNATRKSLQILNIGTGFATVASDTASSLAVPTLGQGYPLEVASAAGHQGGSTPIYDGVNTSTDAWDAVSAAGTTLLVIEGN